MRMVFALAMCAGRTVRAGITRPQRTDHTNKTHQDIFIDRQKDMRIDGNRQ